MDGVFRQFVLIEDLLAPYLQDPLCRGIGEIGLETGNLQETEVLLAQLELGRHLVSSGAVVGVHTPRSNKVEITQTTLGLLDQFTDLARPWSWTTALVRPSAWYWMPVSGPA